MAADEGRTALTAWSTRSAIALFLTLAMRFIGAFLFGRLGDAIGRKPALMIDILSYSIIGAAAAFALNGPSRPVSWAGVVLAASNAQAARIAASMVSAHGASGRR